MENDDGVLTLTIRCAELEDAGKYTCKIEEFGKEGEDTTSCDVTIGGKRQKPPESCFVIFMMSFTEYPHKFTNSLQGKNVVEDDKVEFKLEVEDDEADVKWFKDGVEIIPDGKRYMILLL